MYQNIFDTHAHYDDHKFDDDRCALLDSLPEKGVCGVVNAASDLASSVKGMELTARWPWLYCAVGVHPHEADGFHESDLAKLAEFSRIDKVVAIGEIGRRAAK